MSSTSLVRREGQVRTDLYCHNCDGNFIALIDYDVDGNHVLHCPHCAHEHCRVIKAGVCTAERFDSRWGPKIQAPPKHVWKAQDGQKVTSSASAFMRDRWFNRSDSGYGDCD